MIKYLFNLIKIDYLKFITARGRSKMTEIKDKDLETEIERYKVTIDLAFTDDFF